MELSRRAVLGFGVASFAGLPQSIAAGLLTVPTVDSLELSIVVDNFANVFAADFERFDISVSAPIPAPDYHATYIAEWGYSLLARSAAPAATPRNILVDFGYTSRALINNLGLLGVRPETLDAMVLSHGHYDHFGGLDGLLATRLVRRGTPLFIGGEEAFCARLRGTKPGASSFGAIDRPALSRAGINLIVSGDAKVVAGQAFTTGEIAYVSSERPRVPTAMLPGQNCNRALLDPSKRDVDFIVDDAVHELGTAFNVAGRGLVVIGSCSHRGIINTVRRAQAVSGIDRVHAIVGGFHLVPPQTKAQALETIALMQSINPDYIIPGHCSGDLFISAATQAMPDKVIRSVVGASYRLGRRT
ncbi:MBL fold metallo-hydrolase [Sphingomonas sp. H39-1-10]|uniref:MBL fold metallo-hydrolase n=1 Tax=Sphingomonas pollutisoli TaxID=3030829 RepID=UPI0023B8A85F|nr:MBL fold metallo-hydrolase [Sphingomonas pollutisoli]MDF0490314.1 MBL fold metallo-hydrolase [Sphingomonas pollutisoli]